MSSSIIITGASSGIGRAVSKRLAHWDGCLVLTGRSRQRLEEAKAQVEEHGGRAAVFPCDLTEPASVDDLVAYAETQDSVYGVIMSAGAGTYGKVEDQSAGEWSHVLEVNLLGPYHLARTALPRMATREKGHFVFINSVAGFKTFPGNSAYVAAKHGLRGFAETLRLEAREYRIKVTSIFPGATNTEWWDKQEGDFPRKRMLDVDDVAAAVDFALNFSKKGVVEELVLRHRAGDF
ncbi:MAG: SDR family oxidoreductase [Fidelibacterota bacterium]|nr:MAG: SDR family oxidoreductase [Candidatus Neomarinimicrobiota bacterium]